MLTGEVLWKFQAGAPNILLRSLIMVLYISDPEMVIYMRSDEIAVIIPARYGSTRLPGKSLMKVNEKPIIQWVYERATQSSLAGSVIIATDDDRIYDAAKSFGGQVEMTSSHHNSGSDRIAEIARKNPAFKIIVNVQGDEPLIDPQSIDLAVKKLIEDRDADISTLIRVITDEEEINNPNVVKAVIDNSGYAMYFSRSTIPYPKNLNNTQYFAHIGLYAYRRESLLKLTELAQTDLEKAESLEQLRAIQNGMKIKTIIVDYKPIGIDTKEDLEAFKKVCATN